MSNEPDSLNLFATLATIGVVAGLGQLLASEERLNWRIVVGRAMSSAALGVAAGAVLILLEGHVPDIALYGMAAILASLGTSGLELLLQKYLKINP